MTKKIINKIIKLIKKIHIHKWEDIFVEKQGKLLGEKYFYYLPIYRFCKICKKVQNYTEYGWINLIHEESEIVLNKMKFDKKSSKFIIRYENNN